MLTFEQLTGIIILLICTVLFIVLGVKVSQKYNETKTNVTLIFALNFIFTAFALGSIAANRFLLNTFSDPFLGIVFHNVAMGISLFILVLLDIFAFLMTYPERVRVLTLLVSILAVIILVFLLLNQPSINPLAGNELVYNDFVIIVILIFLIPLIVVPIGVFFYFSVKIKEISKPKSIRSTWMGIASIVITVAYLFELAGNIGILTIIIRTLFLVYGILMYICFIMPDWFKKRINWEED